MSRQRMFSLAVCAVLVVCIAIVVRSMIVRDQSQASTVIVGSAPPIATATPDSGRQAVAPGVDVQTGVLTIQVGDAVDSNGVQLSVTKVTAPFTSQGHVPAQGQFMLVDVQVHNSEPANGDVLTISSLTNFQLVDGAGRSYQQAAVAGFPKPPDGSVSPGSTLSGSLAYDVPLGQSYRLLFNDKAISSGPIAVDLGKH